VSAFLYPVTLDLDGRPCLVVGGGVIAERKVRGLLEAGARVTVVSPALSPVLVALATDSRVTWRRRAYTLGDAAGFFLVMVATDDGVVNDAVAVEARAGGALVNCADDPDRCDFILPAVLRRGALTVAVSTGGASPTLARVVREELDAVLPADYAALTRVVGEVRRTLRARGVSPDAECWVSALDAEVRRLVTAGRSAEARERLEGRLSG
jgi:precorrin-2 dehydrogenase/sirohydrochlorin ferrochelatase